MNASASEHNDIVVLANRLADAARAEVLPLFRSSGLHTDSKETDHYDPVTQADRAAERAMRDILDQERPHDAILGEEFGAKAGSSGLTWVLDPIDGTRGFISGTPTWGVLIAVRDAHGPFFGMIDQPYIGERFVGTGAAAWLDGPMGHSTLATRPPRSLSEATVFTTFPEVGTTADATAFQAVASRARLTRYGMDCYAYALLSAGQIDLVIEAELQPYDIQAPIALVQAAGGIVTDWRGNPAHEGGHALAAANASIHRQALDILKRMPL